MCIFLMKQSKLSSHSYVEFHIGFPPPTKKSNQMRPNEKQRSQKTSYSALQTLQNNDACKNIYLSWEKKDSFSCSSTVLFKIQRSHWELPSTIAAPYWCHRELQRLYLVMTQVKTEGLFIRDYAVVRRLIPSGGKRLGLTFISDLPRQRERDTERG